jgi:hypothetical protein
MTRRRSTQKPDTAATGEVETPEVDAAAEPVETPTTAEETPAEQPPAEAAVGGPEARVRLIVKAAARGAMATRLLEAADELGYPRGVVRSVSGGFDVPRGIAVHLFPSEYPED